MDSCDQLSAELTEVGTQDAIRNGRLPIAARSYLVDANGKPLGCQCELPVVTCARFIKLGVHVRALGLPPLFCPPCLSERAYTAGRIGEKLANCQTLPGG